MELEPVSWVVPLHFCASHVSLSSVSPTSFFFFWSLELTGFDLGRVVCYEAVYLLSYSFCQSMIITFWPVAEISVLCKAARLSLGSRRGKSGDLPQPKPPPQQSWMFLNFPIWVDVFSGLNFSWALVAEEHSVCGHFLTTRKMFAWSFITMPDVQKVWLQNSNVAPPHLSIIIFKSLLLCKLKFQLMNCGNY